MNQTVDSNRTQGPDVLDTTLRGLQGLIVCICVVGIVGSGAVAWQLGFRVPRAPYCTYVLHLALADLLFLVCMVAVLALAPGSLPYEALRRVKGMADTAGLSLLTAISVQRCLSVLFPVWYKCARPRHLSATVCALLWALAGLSSALLAARCFRDLSAPAQSAPALNVPTQRAPALNAPAQSAPALSTPTQSAPTWSAPALSTPTRSAPALSTPTQSPPTLSTPTQSAPALSAPPTLPKENCFVPDFIFRLLTLSIFTPLMALASLILFFQVQKASRRRRRPTRLYLVILASVLAFLACTLPLGIYWLLLYLLELPPRVSILIRHLGRLSSAVSCSVHPIIYFLVGRWRGRGRALREPLGSVLQRVLREEPELGPTEPPNRPGSSEGS